MEKCNLKKKNQDSKKSEKIDLRFNRSVIGPVGGQLWVIIETSEA